MTVVRRTLQSGLHWRVVVPLILLVVAAWFLAATPAFAAECADCHYNPGVIAHPAASSCSTCHPFDGGVLGASDNGEHYDGQSDAECYDCHSPESNEHFTFVPPIYMDGVTWSGATYTCADCHNASRVDVPMHPSHDGGFTDPYCADCHNQDVSVQHADECSTCHDSTDPTVIAAIAANDTSCGACHDVASAHTSLHAGGFVDPECAVCHNANISTEHTDNCAGCHSSADPDVITAIATGDVTCGACHDLSTAHYTLHNGGFSATVCAQCHDQNVSTEHTDNCVGCHDSTDPDVVAAILANDVTCEACHEVATAPAHTLPHDDGFVDPVCAVCHDANISAEHASDCASCHESIDPTVTGAITAHDQTCAACHDVATAPAHTVPHDDGFTDPLCASCHDANVSTEHADNCAGCHLSTDPTVVAAIAANDQSCTACHDLGAGHQAAHDDGFVDPLCAGCHEANISTEHADNCASCHSSTDPDVVAAIAAGDVTCGACHDVASAHTLPHDEGFTDPACASCHEANISTEHADNCAGCHNSTDPDVVAAIAAGDQTCGACHDVAGAHAALHDDGFSDPSCAICHDQNVSTEHADNCAGCHNSTDPDVVAAIAANDVTCSACHNVGTAHTTQHAGIVYDDCSECHDGDALSLHAGCGTCHGAVATPPGADCVTCHPAMTQPHMSSLFDPEAYNPGYPGYLSWSWAVANAGESGTPHGNYGTTTNKCQVCHAVHRANADGNVLTAVPLQGVAQTSKRTFACAFCHGASNFTDKTIAVAADGSISPHGNCSRCHIVSPHGVGASVYPVLKERLINTSADARIGNDVASGNNGMDAAGMMDSGSAAGLTLGTGYLCNGCHSSGGGTPGINTVYAVNEPGATPAASDSTLNNTTGHRVTAVATDSWNADPTDADGIGAFFSGRVAFNDANSCQACHDAKRANGDAAFPHGYVDAAGAYAPKSQAGASLIWLTVASDADEARTLLPTPGSTSGEADVSLLSSDGACIKCHISGDGTAGVGLTY